MKLVIIGTGYVGLVTGVCLAELGNTVICVDNNATKVAELSAGTPTIYEDKLEELLKKNIFENRISFTRDLDSVVNSADLIFIAVGTPPKDDTGETDTSAILGVTRAIAKSINHDAYVVIKSTTPVGTADLMKEAFTKSLPEDKPNLNIFVSVNPEFLREGTAIYDFMHPDRIVIGTEDAESEDRLSELYAPFEEDKHIPVLYTDIASAQIIKYASNAFNAAKISFINSISQYAASVGGDISDIATGIGMDKRIGPAFLNAGIGFGGSCFPKDIASLRYEISKASTKNGGSYDKTEFLSGITDENFKAWWRIIELVHKMRNENQIPKEPIIAVLGLAFKPNTDDVRCAPAINIISELSYYAKIRTYDPIATQNAKIALMGKDDDDEDGPVTNNITFCDSLYDAITGADVVILCTEWSEFKNIGPLTANKMQVLMRGNKFIDGRNALDREQMSQIFDYYCIGKPHIPKE